MFPDPATPPGTGDSLGSADPDASRESKGSDPQTLGQTCTLIAGYFVCLITLARGIFDLTEYITPWDLVFPKDTGVSSYAPVGYAFFLAFAAGDVVMAIVGAYGIHTRAPKLVSLLVLWGLWSSLFLAPLMGFVIHRFASSLGWEVYAIGGADLLLNLLLAYVGFRVVIVCAATEKAWSSSSTFARVHKKRPKSGAHWMTSVLNGLHVAKSVPRLFIWIPLEEAVAVYILLVGVLSVYGICFLIYFHNGAGGWAWVVHVPGWTWSRWIEAALDALALPLVVLGLVAVDMHRQARSAERRSRLQAGAQHTGAPDVLPDTSEETRRRKKRASLLLLCFTIFDALRFAFFVPVTGLALLTADLCGFYVHGVAGITAEVPLVSQNLAPLYCHTRDVVILLAALAVALFEGYCLYGTYSLWRSYCRGETVVSPIDVQCQEGEEGPLFLGYPGPGYGAAAPPRGPRA